MPRTRLQRLLHPDAVALVGATERPGYARRLLGNILEGGYEGQVYPVSRSRDRVVGLPAYPTLSDVPVPVDVALVVVPAAAVPDVVRECVRLDVAAAVIVSSGFGEAGVEGRQRREELRAAAAGSDIIIVGPNGNGYACASAGLWATTFSGLRHGVDPPVLPVALLSQSGGSAFGAGHERAQDLGYTFDAIFSTGNEEVTTSEQLAEQLLADGAKVVAMVCEELHDGPALLRAAGLARELGASIVVLKVGRSEAGRAAAATHTAALAGDDAVIDGVLRQHGVVRVDDVDELVQAVRYLATADRPAGPRVAVLSHSGGLGSLAADALGTNGFELPPFPDEVVARLDELLGSTGGRSNPLDITMALRDPVVTDVVATLITDAGVDLVQVVTAGDTALPGRVTAGVAAGDGDAPAHLVWASGLRRGEDLHELERGETPWFTGAAMAAKVLGRILAASGRPGPSTPSTVHRSGADVATLDEVEGKTRLAAAGFDVPPSLVVADVAELRRRSGEVPSPWVLKVASAEVLHKAAAGLVALDLDADRLPEATERLEINAVAAGLQHRRWLLEQQADVAAELYLGCTIDPHLGPVVGVGPGGGDVELLRHVIWATCPVSDDEAEALVTRDDVLARWARFRGLDLDALRGVAAAVARLSRWFVDSPDAPREVEINPLAITTSGRLLVLDSVLRMAVDVTAPARN